MQNLMEAENQKKTKFEKIAEIIANSAEECDCTDEISRSLTKEFNLHKRVAEVPVEDLLRLIMTECF